LLQSSYLAVACTKQLQLFQCSPHMRLMRSVTCRDLFLFLLTGCAELEKVFRAL
jgi:hypothetical protein